MRVGQHGTLTRQWAERGRRLEVVKQTEYQWRYLYGAICPETGDSVGLVLPESNTSMMNIFNHALEKSLSPNQHAIVVMDRASWHHSKNLYQPDCLTFWYLPPYSPELNPAERVWAHLRQNHLANQVFSDYEDIVEKVSESWVYFSQAKETVRPLTSYPCIKADF